MHESPRYKEPDSYFLLFHFFFAISTDRRWGRGTEYIFLMFKHFDLPITARAPDGRSSCPGHHHHATKPGQKHQQSSGRGSYWSSTSAGVARRALDAVSFSIRVSCVFSLVIYRTPFVLIPRERVRAGWSRKA